MEVSKLSKNIIGSEIIKIANEVNEKTRNGEEIFNFTIGDFNPKEFPIPTELKQFIIDEYSSDQTNYPTAEGMLELRVAVQNFLKERGQLDYKIDEILIGSGARPVIYSIFKALVDPGDFVLFATPSWNNNHYTYLAGANSIKIETSVENNFMPSAADFKPHLSISSLVALCSPQNPTGTVFSKQSLEEICDLIIEENRTRKAEHRKLLYVMYDQIYWALTQEGIEHYNPVTLRPEMKEYTIFVDGVSKSLSATGIRVGWSMGPAFIINKMKAILTHVGAWAPRAEQLATAKYLSNLELYDKFLIEQKNKIKIRLDRFYNGFQKLKSEGFKVDAVSPQAGIYLTVQFDLVGQKTSSGELLNSTEDVAKYLLDDAKIAIVPFYAFGSSKQSTWYRVSIGTCRVEDIDRVFINIKQSLQKLSQLVDI